MNIMNKKLFTLFSLLCLLSIGQAYGMKKRKENIQEETLSLSVIPLDCLGNIFDYIGRPNEIKWWMMVGQLVCKEWKGYLEGNYLVRKREEAHRNLLEVTINAKNINSRDEISGFLKNIVDNGKMLDVRFSNISDLTKEKLHTIVSLLGKNIAELTLSSAPGEVQAGVLQYHNELCNILCLRLGWIDFQDPRQITDEDVALIPSFTSLKKLVLIDCRRLTNVGVGHISKHEGLLNVAITVDSSATDHAFTYFASHPTLQQLSIMGANITDEGKLWLRGANPNLMIQI